MSDIKQDNIDLSKLRFIVPRHFKSQRISNVFRNHCNKQGFELHKMKVKNYTCCYCYYPELFKIRDYFAEKAKKSYYADTPLHDIVKVLNDVIDNPSLLEGV